MSTDTRNYVAAWVDWNTDKIIVLERDSDGILHKMRYNSPYYFYVPDENGEFESIFGHKLALVEFDNRDDFNSAKEHFARQKIRLFESDIAPIKRVLMDNYYNRPAPSVNYAFIDIEVDYSQKIGFANVNPDVLPGPYASINAVTLYQSWTKKYLTYVVPPKGYTGTKKELDDKIKELIDKKLLREEFIPEITICSDEKELVHFMLSALQNADIISGWNSEFFDIPYICERLLLIGGKQLLARLDHVGVRYPTKIMVDKFGSDEPIYKLYGKTHLDYMALLKKFTFEGRTSYALGNILQEEVGVGKLEYEGTLERLYNNDFPTFTAYNFRDVDGIVQLDAKFKFIALVNQMAHESTVDFSAMLGTVAYVETAIANHAHYVLKKIVHDKQIDHHDKVEGAIVLTPTPKVIEMVGSVDVRSQYPNGIRSLNISPEMIRGQFGDIKDDIESGERAWRDIRTGNAVEHILYLETGGTEVHTAEEWRWELLQRGWAISAFGTVFDQSRGPGIVAIIVGFWYNERKRLQAEKKKYDKLAKNEIDSNKKKDYEKQAEHFDLLQLTKKISMNSLYGALLNAAFRFGDMRMGASVTGIGRAITTHMLYTIEELITGVSKYYVKVPGHIEKDKNKDEYNKWHYITQRKQLEILRDNKKLLNPNYQLPENFIDFEAIIYSDTDSCYFKTFGQNKEEAVEIADLVCAQVNASFKPFMRSVFLCRDGFDGFVEAGREVVAIRGLFQAKKKYILKIIDLEGFPPKPGKDIKSQGSEIKKADTPKIIQKFIKQTVDMILDGKSYDEVATFVNQQRREILKKKENVFSLGVAKQVNNLDKFIAEYHNPGTVKIDLVRKLTIPGHVRAACNYGTAIELFDKGAKAIKSGDKVLIFQLKPNQLGFNSIAFPADFSRFPKWFDEHFLVDVQATESKMFDNKLKGIFAALEKDLPTPQSVLTNSILEF